MKIPVQYFQIEKDEKRVESIRAQCYVPLKQEAMIGHCHSNSSLNKYCLDLFLEENLLLFRRLLSLIPQTQFLHPWTQPNNNLSFEGSSSSSNPSNEASSFVSYASQFPQHGHMKLSIGGENKNAEEEECRASSMELKNAKLETCQKGCMSSTKVNQDPSGFVKKGRTEV